MLDAWRIALTWFLFVAVWLLRASLLCNAQAFQWKHFYRQTEWQRGRDTARLFDCCCFFGVCVLCSFIANFLFLSFLFWAVWFLSAFTMVTLSKWLCPPPPPHPHLQEKVLKNGIRYVVCIVVYHFSHTHTHTPRSSLLVHAVSVCFIVDLAGRQSGPPATAQGTVCTVNLAPVFFFLFFFSSFFKLLSDGSGCGGCFVFCFFRGLWGLTSWRLGGSALRWEADNGKVCVFFFLWFKVNMVWELLGSEAAQHWSKKKRGEKSDSAIWSTTRLLVLCELPLWLQRVQSVVWVG